MLSSHRGSDKCHLLFNQIKINANSLMCEIFWPVRWVRMAWQELCQGGQNKMSNVEISSHCEGIYVSANRYCVCGANVEARSSAYGCMQATSQAKATAWHPAVACSTVFSLLLIFSSFLSLSFFPLMQNSETPRSTREPTDNQPTSCPRMTCRKNACIEAKRCKFSFLEPRANACFVLR